MKTVYSNSVERSESTNRSFGFVPVPGKFGATTNYENPYWNFEEKFKNIS